MQESIRENLLLRTGTSVLVNESRQKPVASAIPVDVLKEINSRVWVSRRKIKSIINAYVQENFSLRVALEDLLGNETVNRIRLNEIKKENSEDLQLLQKLLQLKSGEAESLKLENAQLQESLAQTKQKQCLNCLREKRINVHRDGLILPENKRTAMREDELELSYKGKSEKIDENDLLVEIGRLEQTILNR